MSASTSTRERRLGLVALLVVALALVITAVPGVFTVDEDNYLVNVVALRAGRLGVPGTEGLPPSQELLFFDPALDERSHVTMPAMSTAPPLWAPLALPFSYLGWYGLVTINALAFVATAALAFLLVAGRTRAQAPPWIAAVCVLVGGYSLEYAQGVWPHMLSMALVFGSFYALVVAIERSSARHAVLSGFTIAVACGLRYPNALALVVLGVCAAWLATRKVGTTLGFALGAAPPLVASASMNHARLGIFNPVTKGPSYLQLVNDPGYGPRWLDALNAAFARIVDFSAQKPLLGQSAVVHRYMKKSVASGVYTIGPAVKKAWLQSVPWGALALVFLGWALLRRDDNPHTRTLRPAALVVFVTIAVIAWSGSSRVDGLAFNQRYFIDLLPFAAVALAFAVEDVAWSGRAAAAGAVASLALAALTFRLAPHTAGREHLVARVPLVIAALLVVSWALRSRRHGSVAISTALAACVAWALGVHVGDDLATSRHLRETNAEKLELASPVIHAPAAVFAYWGEKDALGPLLLDRDVVILDVWPDKGASAPALVEELLRRGRRVYCVLPMPPPILAAIAGKHAVAPADGKPGSRVLEVIPRVAP